MGSNTHKKSFKKLRIRMMGKFSIICRWNNCPLKERQKSIKLGVERQLSNQESLLLLEKTQVQFPAPTRWITTLYKSNIRRSDALCWPLWALQAHIDASTHTHMYKNKSLKRKQSSQIFQNNLGIVLYLSSTEK